MHVRLYKTWPRTPLEGLRSTHHSLTKSCGETLLKLLTSQTCWEPYTTGSVTCSFTMFTCTCTTSTILRNMSIFCKQHIRLDFTIKTSGIRRYYLDNTAHSEYTSQLGFLPQFVAHGLLFV